MESYVDKIGDFRLKDIKKKKFGDIKDEVLRELGVHTEKLSREDGERRGLVSFEMGPFSQYYKWPAFILIFHGMSLVYIGDKQFLSNNASRFISATNLRPCTKSLTECSEH